MRALLLPDSTLPSEELQAPENPVVMGHVGVPFGVRGWIRVHPYTESGDSLLDYREWWLGKKGRWHRYKVLECAAHSKFLVARLESCADREAAALLRGSEVAVPRDSMPETEEGEYYWADLIGLKVVNTQGLELGAVTGLLETGANDVLVVQGDEAERLVPFIGQVVQEVDKAGGVIRVEWGLDW